MARIRVLPARKPKGAGNRSVARTGAFHGDRLEPGCNLPALRPRQSHVGAMGGEPGINDRARQVVVPEERMKTMQADLSATSGRFRADMASRYAAHSEGLWAATDRLAAATDSMASSRRWQTATIVSVVPAAMAPVVALY